MTCPKCGATPKEYWYDGSCIEHGRPEMIDGRFYYLKYDGEWSDKPWEYRSCSPFSEGIEAAIPVPRLQELLLLTKGKI